MTSAVQEGRPSAGAELDMHGGKYLTFRLGGEEYGVKLLKVCEIVGIMEITAVPQMPAHVKGVISLRGKIIPVVDLRLKFGMDAAEYTDATCIIVVDVGTLMGIVVDTVQEVLDIDGSQIEPSPALGASVDTTFILGMAPVRDEAKILLDLEQVLNEELVAQLAEA